MDEPRIELVVARALVDAAQQLRELTTEGRLHLLALTIESRAEYLAARLERPEPEE